MKKFYFLLSIFFLVSEALAAHAAWEKINGFSREFYFIDHSEQFLTVTVQSTTGKNLYLLSMGINAWDFANNDFEYSGDFECRLTKVGGGYSEDLLWDDPHASSDSEGRGRFMQAQLQGRCWDYPDYGHDKFIILKIKKNRSGDLVRGLEALKISIIHLSFWTLYLGTGVYIRNKYGMEAAQIFELPSMVIMAISALFFLRK